jgi:hypothetical protein
MVKVVKHNTGNELITCREIMCRAPNTDASDFMTDLTAKAKIWIYPFRGHTGDTGSGHDDLFSEQD